jgi:CubicO group peptidase (beta-lactamase class C family)
MLRRSVLATLGIWLLATAAGCDSHEQGRGELPGSDGEGIEAWAATRPADDLDSAPPSLLDHRHPPATSGMDPGLLTEALERAASLSRLHNMIVARHGDVVVERHFRGPDPSRPANVKSVSKSLLSAVVGLAIEDGHLSGVDEPIVSYFEGYLDDEGAAEREGITVGHLLSMSSGLESTSSRNYGRWVTSPDWVRHAVTRPLLSPPGDRMAYSTGSTHLASAVLTRATGRTTHAFAQERLAGPLGIQLPRWPRDPQGIYFGGNDMLVSPRALLRFGELYRNGGVHEGERILAREWVEESWRVHVVSPRRNRNGYGLGWWARTSGGHEVRFAWGYGGQFLFVVPALELTVVFTSDPWSPREGPHNAALHDLLDRFLVPAAEAGSAEPEGTVAEAGRG